MTIDDLEELDEYTPWAPLKVDCLIFSDELSAVILPLVVAAETLQAVKETVDCVLASRRANYPGS